MDDSLGWWADPIYLTGQYPISVLETHKNYLKALTKEESDDLKGSSDFFGLNFYTARYVSDPGYPYGFEQRTTDSNGTPIGPLADATWLYVVPWSFNRILKWGFQISESDLILHSLKCKPKYCTPFVFLLFIICNRPRNVMCTHVHILFPKSFYPVWRVWVSFEATETGSRHLPAFHCDQVYCRTIW